MKIFILTSILIFMSTNVYSGTKLIPDGTRSSKSNIFGGDNFYDKRGSRIGFSRPNLFGGKNYYNQRGSIQIREYVTPNGSRYGR